MFDAEPEPPVHVEGRFPEWLRGRLLRTAPALFERDHWAARHWFDALGMLYRFDVEGPVSVRFRQRLLDSEVARAAARGPVPYSTFGSGNGRSLVRRLVEPIPKVTDNANVHVIPAGGAWVAMTETDRQLRIDPDTLETLGPATRDPALPRLMTTAHPLRDAARDAIVNVGSLAGARPEIVAVLAPARGEATVIGRWRTPRLPYLHSFGLCEDSVVLVAQPFDVHPMSLLWSNDFIEHFRWRPSEGTRVIALSRAGGNPRIVDAPPFFFFHTVNTFKDGQDLIVDLLTYPDPSIATLATRTRRLKAEFPSFDGSLTRVSLTPRSQTARVERLCEAGFDFPAICPDRQGKRHRHVWGVSATASAPERARSEIVRVDVETARVDRFGSTPFLFGEPVLVPAPEARSEDDGVVLTVGTHAAGGAAKLVALDARDLRVLAEARVDAPLPFGFHGSFERWS